MIERSSLATLSALSIAVTPTEAPRTQTRSTFKKRLIRKFSGEPMDYARFQSRWKEVENEFSEESQFDLILEQVPQKVKSKINTCRMMVDVLERLNNDFGRPNEVTAHCLQGLIKELGSGICLTI